MKRQSHHRYPQTLIDFQHLTGGSYGTLSMIARDHDTLEVRMGNDFVRMNADGAAQMVQALGVFAGADLVVEIEEEEEETEVIVEPPREEPKLGRPRRVTRRQTAR